MLASDPDSEDTFTMRPSRLFRSNGRKAWPTRHGPNRFVMIVSITGPSIFLCVLNRFPCVVINTGVVDQDVEVIVPFQHLICGSFDAARIGDIQGNRFDSACLL